MAATSVMQIAIWNIELSWWPQTKQREPKRKLKELPENLNIIYSINAFFAKNLSLDWEGSGIHSIYVGS